MGLIVGRWSGWVTFFVVTAGCSAGSRAPEALEASPAGIWSTCDFTAGAGAGYREPPFTAQEAELRIFAIHEATTTLGDPMTRRANGQAAVHVERAVRTVLVLSAFEATHWTVTSEAGGLERVILDGSGEQTATVPAGVVVERASFSACGYADEGECRAGDLIGGAEADTGLALTAFAGCRYSTEFALRDSE